MINLIEYALTRRKLTSDVSDYLDEHLTNPTNPPIDNSLAIEGAAADAKATGDAISALNADLNDIMTLVEASGTLVEASGSIVETHDAFPASPEEMVVDINPVQSGSGDPSPSNVRPISGWTQVNVNHSDADMTNPTTITIDLGQTVYGGSLDVLTGVLTVEKAMVDLGTVTWLKKVDDPSYGTFFYTQSINKAYNSNIICSAYVTVLRRPEWGTLDKIISGNATSKSVYIRDSSCNNLSTDEFKTAMSGVQLVYELAEPIEYQLTPQQVTLSDDYNALWADTGDISEFAYLVIGEFATKTELADIESKVDTNNAVLTRNSRMQMGAHRGAENYAPPNSVVAYEIAGKMGFPWAWLAKIRWSSEGTLYVMHDDDVSITTNGTGNLSELTDEYINSLLVNKPSGYDYSQFTNDDLRVPTLEKAIQICLRYGMKMCFRIDPFPNQIETELHQTIWDNFESLVKGYGISADWCCYSGYNVAEMTRCITLFGEDAELCPYLGNVSAQNVVDWFNSLGVTVKRKSVLLDASNVTLAVVKLLHTNGIKVYAFTNSSTPSQELMEQLATWGVDILQNPKYARIPIS